ncbi:MAG: pyridoxal-phosphate dependent enzyme [Bryobacterales bacterium]|nr:pyridoxal-phosphate dependent enzyme [Bryobacterales bacterium]
MIVEQLASMGEGQTPLVGSRQLAHLHFKLEQTNPSGSYKDRFIAAELSRVLLQGQRVCVATSSGNTGSSLAAYCARYDVRCAILVNADAPAGKLLQMQAHGAKVIRIAQFAASAAVTERVFAQLQEFTARGTASLVVSAFRYCPGGMQGVKAIAREIVQQFPGVRHVFVPVGGGGLFAAVSDEMQAIQPQTLVHAVQPEGCPTLWNAWRNGLDRIAPVESTTRISGLSVPFDIDAGLALRMLRQGGGQAFAVSDGEVFDAQRHLLRREGIYAEPAGAAALAGYRQACRNGAVREGEAAVCLVTGHGFKDPASIASAAEETPSYHSDGGDLLAVLEEVTR